MNWQLLADVPPEEVRMLLQVARRRRFAKREVVFHRDDPADSLHLIHTGRFAVRIMTPLGDIATIAVRGPGETFGEIALVSGNDRRTATVSALEEAETHAVYRSDFDRLRKQHPQITDVLITSFAHAIRALDERLLEALYVPAERRVLRRLAELEQMYSTGTSATTVPLTQELLAELAGTSRATVNRVLNEEQEHGTVELRRGKTIVRDSIALARRAR